MSTISNLDFHALAGSEDLELVSLSDEQFQSLWAMERIEVDPDSAPVMLAGLRSLIAAGLAEATEQDGVQLQGAAALIRQTHTQSLPSIVIQPLSPSDEGPRTWVLAAPGFVLEQQWSQIGVHQFTLRRLARAVRDLVNDLIPEGNTLEDQTWTWSRQEENATARLGSMFESNAYVTQVAVAVPVSNERPGPAVEWTESSWLFVNDGSTPGWVLLSRPDESAEVRPVDRAAARTLFLDSVTSDA